MSKPLTLKALTQQQIDQIKDKVSNLESVLNPEFAEGADVAPVNVRSWELIEYLLDKQPANKDNVLSLVTQGPNFIDYQIDDSTSVSYLTPDEVKQVVEPLNEVTRESLAAAINTQDMTEKNLYGQVGDVSVEELLDVIWPDTQRIMDLFKQSAQFDYGILQWK